MRFAHVIFAILFFPIVACQDGGREFTEPEVVSPVQTLRYLALGDSYTIGESVAETDRFPAQLAARLELQLPVSLTVDYIAQTGWTTTNLKSAIAAQNPTPGYDFVTLLIGVNNQYQNKPFALYQQEFPELLATAVTFAGGDKSRVIVVSIPDYAYTPFGNGTQNQTEISAEIDQYNAFAAAHSQQEGIEFVEITDITRQGLDDPSLVANDGLHPSALAYTLFVDRILPIAVDALTE